jgi:tyrosyl-tRNA synthetase
MSTLYQTLQARGFVHDATPGCADRLAAGPVTAYVGFDPTGDSLHVGHLVAVMGLAWLQRLGGTPIVLVGGGTGLVGDPSGKRSERPMLTVEQVDANVAALAGQLARFLSFEGGNAARMRNNADWLRGLSLLEFLRDTGKHFTVNYMLQKDSVKSRLETGISFTEFTYMLVQAYDFWHLHRTEQCDLQMGGSDQWGNITAGIELTSRREGTQVHGLTFPLLTTSSGQKFGKSEQGAIYLDPARTSPYRFHQYWLNVDDRDVEKCLRLFTFLELDAIAAIMAEHAADPAKRIAQRALADDVTTRVHGADTCARATAAARIVFGGGDLQAADGATFALLVDELPTTRIPSARFAEGLSLLDALVETGLAASKGEARRGLQQKGFSVNGVAQEADRVLGTADLLADGYLLLRRGKKTFALIVAGSALP